MTTDVLAFRPDTPVTEAMEAMVARGVSGAPVVDDDGRVVGVVSTGDLIVREANVHGPTVISILGALIPLPSSERHYLEDLHKALGATVGDVMNDEPVTIGPEATLEEAATLMHDRGVSRLPVVDDEGRLVGIISRADIVRAMVRRG